MSAINTCREALFASNFLPLAKYHLENWMLQQPATVRANLKIALTRQAQARQAAYDNTHSGYHIHSWND